MGLSNKPVIATVQRKHDCVYCGRVIAAFSEAVIRPLGKDGFAHPECSPQVQAAVVTASILTRQPSREATSIPVEREIVKEKPMQQAAASQTPYKPHEPVEGSQHERLFALMLDRASGNRQTQSGRPGATAKKGYVNMTTTELARATGIPEHDVTHALFDMRGRGLVEFRQAKGSGAMVRAGVENPGSASANGGTPVNIRIPKRVLAAQQKAAAAPRAEIAPEVRTEVVSGGVRATLSAIPTRIDLHPLPPADGRPLEDFYAENVTPEQVAAYDARVREGLGVGSGQPSDTSAPLAEILPQPPMEEGGLVPNPFKVSLERYPVIARLFLARNNVAEAVKLLRAADKNELADLVASEAGEPTTLENEVLALIAELVQLRVL